MSRRRLDPTQRLRAVRDLPDTPASCPALLSAAQDPSPEVTRAALQRLAALGGPREAAELRSCLLAVDLALVPAYASTLRVLEDRDAAVGVARAGLHAQSATSRMAAATALREFGDDRTAASLWVALADPIAGVRRLAVEALGALPPREETIAACTRLLSDPDDGVRAACVRVLAEFAPDAEEWLRPALRDPSARVRQTLARCCRLLGEASVSILLCDPTGTVRAEAAWALAVSPRPALVTVLIGALEDPDWQVRRAAARALGAAADRRAGCRLVDTLVDPHATVRAAAIRALGEIFGPRLRSVLAEALETADPGLRRALVYALAETGERAAALAVSGLERDPSPEVRTAVVHALLRLRPAGHLQALECLAADPDPGVRHAVLTALAEEGSPRA